MLGALLAAWLAASGCGRGSPTLPAATEAASVTRVVDGDTLVVAGGERVRLIGVDAPESVKPHSPVECYGREASRHLALLLPPGTPVRLEADVEPRDRYGRMLAYVYRVGDGLFVNAAMVRDGYAQPLSIPPNVAHADEFVALARQARQTNRGLWSACPPGPATG
ncbi:MAG TPA: thermonuclease family protein [Egibacteraceae bacterium]|nr:thermonuclease family protein [Egibacteraceae bacterium]